MTESDYNIFPNADKRTPKRGDCLVAQPLLSGAAFSRSVVLICDRDDAGGFFGLTLNKPTPLHIKDIIPDAPPTIGQVQIWCGGPVDFERLFILHSSGLSLPGSAEIESGLCIGGNLKALDDLIRRNQTFTNDFKCLAGYSGWAPGQLETEIAEGSWAILPGVPLNPLSGNGNEYWRRAVVQLGQNYRPWLIVPRSPIFN